MDFIQFLKEEPYYNMPDLVVECPHKNHQGGPIIGSNVEWMFDYYGEHFHKFTKQEDANKKILAIRNVTKNGIKKGIIPVFCRVDKVVFMWNTETDYTYAPKTFEDKTFCDIVAKALLVTDGPSHTNEDLNITETSILRPEDSKR